MLALATGKLEHGTTFSLRLRALPLNDGKSNYG